MLKLWMATDPKYVSQNGVPGVFRYGDGNRCLGAIVRAATAAEADALLRAADIWRIEHTQLAWTDIGASEGVPEVLMYCECC